MDKHPKQVAMENLSNAITGTARLRDDLQRGNLSAEDLEKDAKAINRMLEAVSNYLGWGLTDEQLAVSRDAAAEQDRKHVPDADGGG